MKVSEMTGAQLDYWVAKAENIPLDAHGDRLDVLESYGPPQFTPSTNWAQGGPIIEREDIGWMEGYAAIDMSVQGADDCYGAYGDFGQYGDTPLIAAMRCFVASKYGDTVPEK